MPYQIYKTGDQWCVHKKEDGQKGERVPGGCHPSYAKALKHMRALYVHVPDAREFEDIMANFYASFKQAFPDEPVQLLELQDDFALVASNEMSGYLVPYSVVGDDNEIVWSAKEYWKKVKLFYVEELLPLGRRVDISAVWEFKGSYPNVPLFEDVNIDDLSPVFVTLPIGIANVMSANGRYYDEAWLMALEEQVRKNRPGGSFGHLPDTADEQMQFPREDLIWVGVMREGNILWGKAYLATMEARERFKLYKETGRKIGTSIDGRASGIWDESLGGYRMLADSFSLDRIDIGPYEKLGIRDLAVVPKLTREFSEIPPEMVEEIVKNSPLVKEMQAELVNAAIEKQLAEIKSEALRPLVKRFIDLRKPQTSDEVKAICDEVMAYPEMQDILVSVMGKSQASDGVVIQPEKKYKYFQIPEK